MSNHNSHPQVAVIIGAASSVGFELTKCCLKEGMHVVMADKAVTDLCDKVEQLSAYSNTTVLGVVCDVTNLEQVRQLAKQTYHHFKQINLLINNAGISAHKAPIWELTPEHIRKILDVNLHGVIHCIQTFMPFLLKQSVRAHVVNMASSYGLSNSAQMSAYAMSQHALVALTESLYFDLQQANKPVDVSVVCPSFTPTHTRSSRTPHLFTDKFHQILSAVVQKNRSNEDLAKHVMKEIQAKSFYIFSDKRILSHYKARLDAMLGHKIPYEYPELTSYKLNSLV